MITTQKLCKSWQAWIIEADCCTSYLDAFLCHVCSTRILSSFPSSPSVHHHLSTIIRPISLSATNLNSCESVGILTQLMCFASAFCCKVASVAAITVGLIKVLSSGSKTTNNLLNKHQNMPHQVYNTAHEATPQMGNPYSTVPPRGTRIHVLSLQ